VSQKLYTAASQQPHAVERLIGASESATAAQLYNLCFLISTKTCTIFNNSISI